MISTHFDLTLKGRAKDYREGDMAPPIALSRLKMLGKLNASGAAESNKGMLAQLLHRLRVSGPTMSP